jgi:glycosyltransferase involved in cell wall biosynthesis
MPGLDRHLTLGVFHYKMLLSIIIPTFNEEGLVAELLQRVLDLKLINAIEKEIIIVDDGSSDNTAERIRSFCSGASSSPITVIHHEFNRGKGAAVRTGICHSVGEVIIIQDADLEYDPNDINRVVQPIVDGEQVVYGSRILMEKSLKRSGLFGLITGKHPHSYVLAYLGGVLITKWTNILTGANLTDEPTCYKCFCRSALEGIFIECNDFSWEPEITVKLLRKGIKIAEVPISYHPRKNHEGKKINWKHGILALWTILKYRILH